MNKRISKTRDLTMIAIFAALTGVLSQIALPLPITPVPINLAMASVFIAGGLLGAKNATISQIVYVMMGMVGIPVFAKLMGGPGVLTGPTGGYIIGYIAASFVVGKISEYNSENCVLRYVAAMIFGLVACYFVGSVWFMYITKSDLTKTLMMCVVPFLIGDFFKIAISAYMVKILKQRVSIS